MTPEELIKECDKAIKTGLKLGFKQAPAIFLNLKASKNNPKRRRLFGNIGPMGEVCSWNIEGWDTVRFNASDVKAYVEANFRNSKNDQSG